MEPILLLGMVLLLLLYRQLATRIGRLEEQLHALRNGTPAPPPMEASPIAPQPRTPAEGLDAVEGEPEKISVPAPAVRETLATLFERFVAGRLLIWIGGIALAVAGIFLVRYSIEIGLITPPVRIVLAGLFGLMLLGAGELARRRSVPSDDMRIAQALVGAGILILYATPYGAYILYQMISIGTASALMVAVTALALALSLRHGAPTAMMGLIGGFATPLLVGDPDAGAVPLLFYLSLLNVAIFFVAQRRGWTWLLAGAVVLSFVWSGSLLAAPAGDALAAGIFILLLALAASLTRAGDGRQFDVLPPAAIGLVELALLVARNDLGLAAWSLFGLLAMACLLLSDRRPEFRILPMLGLMLALILLAAKAFSGPDPLLPWVTAAITLLFGGFAGIKAAREDSGRLDVLTAAAGFAAPVIILRLARPELLERPLWSVPLILAAAGPALLAWRRRGRGEGDPGLLAGAGAALLLLGLAAYDLLPANLVAGSWIALAAVTARAGHAAADRNLALLALAAAALAILRSMAMVPDFWLTALLSLAGEPALAADLPDLRRVTEVLLVPVPFLLLLSRWLPADRDPLRLPPLVAAGLFVGSAVYIAFKQLFGLTSSEDFVSRGFAERMLITQALFLAGWLIGGRRIRLSGVDHALATRIGAMLTGLAAARLVWFDMLLHNPVRQAQWVGEWPILNLLLPAFLLSAFWLYVVRRRSGGRAASGGWLVLFLAALIAGTALLVRQLFHGAILTDPSLGSAESYGYSLAGLILSIGLLVAGIRLRDKALRVAGLALLTATIFKVFVSDASALEGLLRVLSFLGLGIAVIGIHKLYSAVLAAEAASARGAAK